MEQSDLKIGRWVVYTNGAGKLRPGRIKSWSDVWVFVVYKCNDDWGNFLQYTAAPTSYNSLEIIKE